MRLLAALFSALILLTCVGARSAGPLKRVAIVDTGLALNDPRFAARLCESGHKDFTGKGLADFHGHGTHVAGLIVANAGDAEYCLIILKYYTDDAIGAVNLRRERAAFRWAIEQGAVIVNFSGGGPEFDEDEYLTLRDNPQTTFVVAAGNEGKDLDVRGQEYFPASYKLPNVFAVGSLDAAGSRAFTSGWGSRVRYWERGDVVMSTLPGGKTGEMSGTSMATAVATGKLVAGTLKPRASQCSLDKGGCSMRNTHQR